MHRRRENEWKLDPLRATQSKGVDIPGERYLQHHTLPARLRLDDCCLSLDDWLFAEADKRARDESGLCLCRGTSSIPLFSCHVGDITATRMGQGRKGGTGYGRVVFETVNHR